MGFQSALSTVGEEETPEMKAEARIIYWRGGCYWKTLALSQVQLRPTVDQSLSVVVGGAYLDLSPFPAPSPIPLYLSHLSLSLAPALCLSSSHPFPAWSFFLVLFSDSFSKQAFLGHFLGAICGDRYRGWNRTVMGKMKPEWVRA